MSEKYIYPTYIEKENCWVVQTQYGLEKGSIEYVLSEFVKGGLVYRFNKDDNEHHSHCHTFSGVLAEVINSPKAINFNGFEKDYSEQELRFLKETKSSFIKLKENNENVEVIYSEEEKCWIVKKDGIKQKSESLESCIDLVVYDSLTFNYISYDDKVIHQHDYALILKDLVREPESFISFENCEKDYSEQELNFIKQLQTKLLSLRMEIGFDRLVAVEKYDEQTLNLTFKYGSQKLFNINSILNDGSLHENYRKRFKLMYDAGAFFTAESYNGDLVWLGWCEVFREDLDKYLVEYKS